MQKRMVAEKKGCKNGGMEERRDARHEGFRKSKMQNRRGAGKDGYRKEGVGKGVMQDQLDLIGLELSNGPMANKYI